MALESLINYPISEYDRPSYLAGPPKEMTLDYSDVTKDWKRLKSIKEIRLAAQRGEDISKARENLILYRIKIAKRFAETMARKFPGIEPDDLLQDTILAVIKATDEEIADANRPIFKNLQVFKAKKIEEELEYLARNSGDKRALDSQTCVSTIYKKQDVQAFRQTVLRILGRISKKRKEVIVKKFGLDGNIPAKNKDIEEDTQTTKQNVSMLINSAIENLRKSGKLEDFIDILA